MASRRTNQSHFNADFDKSVVIGGRACARPGDPAQVVWRRKAFTVLFFEKLSRKLADFINFWLAAFSAHIR